MLTHAYVRVTHTYPQPCTLTYRQAGRLGLHSLLSLPASVSGASSSTAAASVIGAANSAGHIQLDTSLSYVDQRNRQLSLKTQAYVTHLEADAERTRKAPKTAAKKPKAVKPANYVPKACPRHASGKCHFGASCWDTH